VLPVVGPNGAHTPLPSRVLASLRPGQLCPSACPSVESVRTGENGAGHLSTGRRLWRCESGWHRQRLQATVVDGEIGVLDMELPEAPASPLSGMGSEP
jgi:hypothetical protein